MSNAELIDHTLLSATTQRRQAAPRSLALAGTNPPQVSLTAEQFVQVCGFSEKAPSNKLGAGLSIHPARPYSKGVE